jgi:general secretion pathway protein D
MTDQLNVTVGRVPRPGGHGKMSVRESQRIGSRRGSKTDLLAQCMRPGSGVGPRCLRVICVLMLLFVQAQSSWGQAFAEGETQTYRLQNSRPVDLAPQVRTLLKQNGLAGEVFIDRDNDGLVIHGPAATQQMAAKLVRTLDRAPAAAQAQPASPASGVVRGYTVAEGKIDVITAGLSQRFPPASGVRIAPDHRTSQLVIVATPQQHAEIAGYIQSNAAAQSLFNQPPTGRASTNRQPRTEPQTYRLQNITWQQFEIRLRQLWGDALNITALNGQQVSVVRKSDDLNAAPIMRINRGANVVEFTDLNALNQPWRQIVAALDRGVDRADATTSLVPLRQADPADVQQAVSMIRDAALRTDAGETVATVPVGEKKRQGRASALVSMIFQPAGQPPAEATGGAAASQAPPPAAPDGMPGEEVSPEDVGLLGDVRIEFIPELGVIILRGNRRDVERVQAIIDEIEKQSEETRPDIQVVPLEHSNSEAMTELVTQVYTDVYESRQGSLSITALVKPNAILLVGRPENIETALTLIDELDKPVSPDAQIRVFRLQHMSATDAAQYIQSIYGAAGQTTTVTTQNQQQARGLSPRVSVIADFRSNSLVVQASPRDLEEVARLLEQLDVDKIEATVELRVFPLKNAMATELATVLQDLLAVGGASTTVPGQPGGAAANQQSTTSKNVQILGVDAQGNTVIESGLLVDVTVSADDNANALIVKAPESTMGLVEALISQLDKVPEAESQIKVFQIRNGDATNLTAMLQQLFGQQVTAGSVGVFTQTLGRTFGTQNQLQQTTAGESSLIPLSFAVDARTNSIVASGSKDDLAIVEAILYRLDEGDLRQRKIIVYRLNNAPAQFVADALNQVLDEQQTLLQQQQSQQFSLISQFEFIDQQVFVVPEVISNTLVVSATPKYYDQITEVIADLDRRPPMIMIQVVVALVRLNDGEELGVELGIQDSLLFDRGTTTDGLLDPGFDFVGTALGNADSAASLATRGLLAGQAFSAFNVGRSSGSEGFPGLVLSASNESLSILIRALARKSRVQIVSRPQIMTMNNVPASVQIGQRVPQITDFQATNQGTVNAVELVEVGVSLGVIPRVTPDGLIIMDIEAGDSQVGDPAEGIPIGVQDGVAINSPIFDDITAITTIAARSGQTVVFGGLISGNRSDTFRGVPFLSDIPVVGHLFRYDTKSEERRELIFFMTPHIVMDDRDLEMLNQAEAERMSWCLADVIDVHGDPGFGPGRGDVWDNGTPVIFPHEDPTADGIMVPPGTEPIPAPRRQPYTVPSPSSSQDRPFIRPPDQRQEGEPFILPPDQRQQGRPFLETPNEQSRRASGNDVSVPTPNASAWKPPAVSNPWSSSPPMQATLPNPSNYQVRRLGATMPARGDSEPTASNLQYNQR